ncbi:hypothetical protein COR50_10225 [Chitinophaga caeni]|uniref:Uncharacterized protein n=1 Tax=Chitinophaga caeni TaxID=2029983 RepID=A0A291QUI6_9BACT|nr:hypothetical protein COR50_10225 [Chitinophaga caeni]
MGKEKNVLIMCVKLVLQFIHPLNMMKALKLGSASTITNGVMVRGHKLIGNIHPGHVTSVIN